MRDTRDTGQSPVFDKALNFWTTCPCNAFSLQARSSTA